MEIFTDLQTLPQNPLNVYCLLLTFSITQGIQQYNNPQIINRFTYYKLLLFNCTHGRLHHGFQACVFPMEEGRFLCVATSRTLSGWFLTHTSSKALTAFQGWPRTWNPNGPCSAATAEVAVRSCGWKAAVAYCSGNSKPVDGHQRWRVLSGWRRSPTGHGWLLGPQKQLAGTCRLLQPLRPKLGCGRSLVRLWN